MVAMDMSRAEVGGLCALCAHAGHEREMSNTQTSSPPTTWLLMITTSPLVGAHRGPHTCVVIHSFQTLSSTQSGNNPARKVALCPFP